MNEFPKPQTGQRVRVVLEGRARASFGQYSNFDIGQVAAIFPKYQDAQAEIKSIEILPDPPKVGDTNLTREQLLALPRYTLLVDRSGEAYRVCAGGGYFLALNGGAYTVEYMLQCDGLQIVWLPAAS